MQNHGGVSGRQTPGASRIAARPRVAATPAPKVPSSMVRSPPLTDSLNFNAGPEKAYPSSSLVPKDGSAKIRIKSATTPEAKSRIMPKMLGRTPGPGSVFTPAKTPLSSVIRGNSRSMTPSDSDSSLADTWIPPVPAIRPDFLADHVEEKLVGSEAVLVTVRVRPPNQAELSRDSTSVWDTPVYDDHVIKLAKGREGQREDKEWIFDRILPPESNNMRAYSTSARTHVKSAMEGYNAVIFAYGQTASGKTFTLTGSPSDPGIIPLSVSDLFAQIRSTPDREFLLRASYLELYNEAILDLLSPEMGKELSLSEGKKKGEVVINGLTECAVRTEEEVQRLLKMGEDRRKVGGTDWNQRSSRSHCVFRIVIESRASSKTQSSEDLGRTPSGRLRSAGEKMTRISTLSIIDLAGSEKHTSSKERNAEGKHINQSLLTLKLVISKLADMATKRNVTHVPYRDSKLTRLLQPSLSGDALISVICTVSPSAINIAESLSTLSFAQGLKRVTLRAQKKEMVDPQALIQQYQNEIAELRALLREKEFETQDSISTRPDKSKNAAMEKRLNELKSLILTSGNIQSDSSTHGETRPLSPTKLKYPKLDFDRSTTKLQEDLHTAELRVAEQEDEIRRLKLDLDARTTEPDSRIQELQQEVSELRMIASDYERHLRDPTPKVREDVEREFAAEIAKLQSQVESKRIWANRLDENVRAVTKENKDLLTRCREAETKVLSIMEWVNQVLSDDPSSPSRADNSLPTLVVSQEYGTIEQEDEVDDFAPPPTMGNKKSTITLTASKMTRAQLSQMDLASFNDRFGTLTLGGRGKSAISGYRMLREESGFDLAEQAGEDEVF